MRHWMRRGDHRPADSGRWILTTAWRPSGSTQPWTWATDAADSGRSSKEANSSSTGGRGRLRSPPHDGHVDRPELPGAAPGGIRQHAGQMLATTHQLPELHETWAQGAEGIDDTGGCGSCAPPRRAAAGTGAGPGRHGAPGMQRRRPSARSRQPVMTAAMTSMRRTSAKRRPARGRVHDERLGGGPSHTDPGRAGGRSGGHVRPSPGGHPEASRHQPGVPHRAMPAGEERQRTFGSSPGHSSGRSAPCPYPAPVEPKARAGERYRATGG